MDRLFLYCYTIVMKVRKVAVVALFVLMLMGIFQNPVLAQFCPGHEGDTADPQVDTALGCIPVKLDQAITWFLPYLFGIAGGISFLLMVYGFIQMTLSSGDPKAVVGAQETVTSAITGLIVSIFALFVIRLIAVGILRIPGIS